MPLLAVMARVPVTQGAVAGYPISGVRVPVLVGQGTCLASLATGADRSEPSGTSRHAGRGTEYTDMPAGRCGCRVVYPGSWGYQCRPKRRAPARCERVHIRVYL